MLQTIITHVGASLLENDCVAFRWFKDRDSLLNELRYERDTSAYLNDATTHLVKDLHKRWSSEQEQRAQRLSESPAEIASLSLLGLGKHDQVVLLHSDTAEGAFCAELLRRVLSNAQIAPQTDYPFCAEDRVTVQRINGLRVTDLRSDQPGERGTLRDTFVREGLTNYVEHVWDAYHELKKRINDYQDEGALSFNVTAGYKGMIPIARDLALLLATYIKDKNQKITTEVCCLYETSSELIRYASLPIYFNWARVDMSQLERAAQEEVPIAQRSTALDRVLYNNIDPDKRSYFVALHAGSPYVRLSPLGRIVWELGKRMYDGSS